MSRIQLVAETPRADKWNHRFIVSSTGDLSESEVAKVVAAARRNLQGEDYLAVSVKTAQSVSGRTGDEILVLTGIEVNKLSGTQRQQIMAQLEQRLAELAVLVTEKIDWERAGQSLLVERAELVEWEKAISDLLRVKKAIPPVKKPPARKWHPSQLKLAGGVIGILLVLGLGIWIGSGLGSKSSDCQTTTPDTQMAIGSSRDSILELCCYSQCSQTHVICQNDNEQPPRTITPINSGKGESPNPSKKSLPTSRPSSDTEGAEGKHLQEMFTNLRQKISGVEWCKSDIARSPITTGEMSLVCEMLKKLNQFEKVNDFIVDVQKISVPSDWCQQFENKRTNFSAVFKKNKAEEVVKLLLDFIQQLNKETSCLKNTK